MSFREFIGKFLTHAACAMAWLLLILLMVERVAPGSILPYFNIYWLIPCLIVLILLVPSRSE